MGKRKSILKRFEKTEILLHWYHALPVLILIFTGFYLAWQGWQGIEHSDRISRIHEIVGVVLIFLAPISAISGNTRLIFKNILQIFHFGKSDLQWIRAEIFKKHGPPQPKFNTGQKLNTIAVFCYTLALQASGIWLWLYPHSLLPRRTHTIIAIFAVFLLMGHLYMAMINPKTRPGFWGIIHGFVPRSYIVDHHSLQLEEIEGLKEDSDAPNKGDRSDSEGNAQN